MTEGDESMGLRDWLDTWELDRPDPSIPMEEIREAVEEIDPEVLPHAIEVARESYEEMDDVRSTTEEKATSILGFSGVAIGFVLTALSLISRFSGTIPTLAAAVVLAFALLAAFFLVFAIARSLQVLRIGEDSPAYTVNPETPMEFADMDEEEARRETLRSLTYCAVNNRGPNNQKGTRLHWAQRNLARGVVAIGIAVIGGLSIILAGITAASLGDVESALQSLWDWISSAVES